MFIDFLNGIRYVFAGFAWIIKPGIRRFVYIPLLINTLLFGLALGVVASRLSDWLHYWIGSPSDWIWGTQWLYPIVMPILSIMIYITLMLVVAFFFLSLANLLAAPFNAWLAKSVEKRLVEKTRNASELLVFPEISIWQEIGITVKSELMKLLRFLLVASALLLLLFVPLINVFFPLAWLVFMAYALSIQYVDYPMANHGFFYPTQRKVLKQSRFERMGFGIIANVLLFIPVVNFLAMPVCVCGATIWWHESLRQKVTK